MTRLTTATLLAAVAAFGLTATTTLACGSCGCADEKTATASSCSGCSSANVVEVATKAGKFNTLLAAAEAAGLVEALQGDGLITVFAPTDEAFAKLPEGTVASLLKPENKAQLAAILTYHVVPGNVDAKHVLKRSALDTLNGQRLAVSMKDKAAYIDNAKVLATDIKASNGTIHVIDSVVLPSSHDVVLTAAEAGKFSTLLAAAKAAGLVEALQGDGPITVFAPTDAAFAKLPAGTVESLLKPENKDQLVSILTYHVVPADVSAASLVGQQVYADTVQGQSVFVSGAASGAIFVSNGPNNNVSEKAKVLAPITTGNGVVHVIDKVLLP